jgi:hypothetical protein
MPKTYHAEFQATAGTTEVDPENAKLGSREPCRVVWRIPDVPVEFQENPESSVSCDHPEQRQPPEGRRKPDGSRSIRWICFSRRKRCRSHFRHLPYLSPWRCGSVSQHSKWNPPGAASGAIRRFRRLLSRFCQVSGRPQSPSLVCNRQSGSLEPARHFRLAPGDRVPDL